MRFLALSALLVSAVAATQLNERFVERDVDVLTKRQQFIPTTTTAQGSSCAEAFGEGYVTCREKSATRNRLCYNPTIGQTCCSEQWACPSKSFCLVDPYCCPEGQDPTTCAAEKGLTLPSDFKTDAGPAPTAKYPAGNATIPQPTGSGAGAGETGPVVFEGSAPRQVGAGLAGVLGVVGAVVGLV